MIASTAESVFAPVPAPRASRLLAPSPSLLRFAPGRGGYTCAVKLGRWRKQDEQHRADKQEGDPHALDVEGDPRGGVQSDEYRHADPREIVEEDSVAMSGPAGAPQEGMSPEERRARDRES